MTPAAVKDDGVSEAMQEGQVVEFHTITDTVDDQLVCIKQTGGHRTSAAWLEENGGSEDKDASMTSVRTGH